MEPWDLVALLGYQACHLPLYAEAAGEGRAFDLEAEADAAVARVKDEIRSGRPALVWHAFSNAEWDVAAGFDDERHLFIGRGSYKGMDEFAGADQRRTITCLGIFPALGVILVGDKMREFDAGAAEVAALQEAVRHARSTERQDQLTGDNWAMLHGLQCYDRWADDWSDPERTLTLGDSYCLGVYRSTHRGAAGFLTQIAPRYHQIASKLRGAAEAFVAEAGALDGATPLLGWGAPAGPDPERNTRAVALLRQARGAYARAIDEIEGALSVLGVAP
jgi:hypothetical protein